MRFFKRKNTKYVKKTFVIGVCGVSKGCGVTHFCISAAHFLKSYAGKKTAVLDCAGSGDYLYINGRGVRIGKENSSIIKKGICFIPYADMGSMQRIAAEGFDICIADYGVYDRHTLNELLRCDLKFIIGTGAVWAFEDWKDFFEAHAELKDWSSFRFCINFGGILDRKSLSRHLPEFITLPFCPNVFKITDSLVSIFYNVFDNIL